MIKIAMEKYRLGSMAKQRLVFLCISLLLILVMTLHSSAWSQEAKLENLKGAFIYKFTHYIEWPSKKEPFTIAVFNNQEMFQVMKEMFKGQSVIDRPVIVSTVESLEKIRSFDLLLINEIEATSNVWDQPLPGILVITQSKNGLHKNAVINFYMDQENKLKFEINNERAISSQLKINSRLLNLSKAQK